MTVRILALFLALAAVVPGTLFAQHDFFLSFSDLNQGAVNESAIGEYGRGSSGSIFIYYSTDGPADSDLDTGAFLDITTSQSGVIRFTGAETFDFDITLFGSPLQSRWDASGTTGTVTDNLVDEMSAFKIFTGVGILEANNGSGNLVDQGFDAGSGAFLFGRVDFEVLADPGPDGITVDIVASAGAGGIVNGGAAFDADFGIATIMVAADEPILGDINGDGVVNMMDVDPFVRVLVNGGYLAEADINGDGRVDLRDVRPFVKLL